MTKMEPVKNESLQWEEASYRYRRHRKNIEQYAIYPSPETKLLITQELTRVGFERIKDPPKTSLSLERARKNWQELGHSDKWIHLWAVNVRSRNLSGLILFEIPVGYPYQHKKEKKPIHITDYLEIFYRGIYDTKTVIVSLTCFIPINHAGKCDT